jgi:hypothetical protein
VSETPWMTVVVVVVVTAVLVVVPVSQHRRD